jgi:hypothetical protein
VALLTDDECAANRSRDGHGADLGDLPRPGDPPVAFGFVPLVIWSAVAPVTVLDRSPGAFAASGRSRELVCGDGWNVFGVIVAVFLAVAVLSIAAGLIAAGLSLVGRALVQRAVNAAPVPIPSLGASVLHFALSPQPSRSGG